MYDSILQHAIIDEVQSMLRRCHKVVQINFTASETNHNPGTLYHNTLNRTIHNGDAMNASLHI